MRSCAAVTSKIKADLNCILSEALQKHLSFWGRVVVAKYKCMKCCMFYLLIPAHSLTLTPELLLRESSLYQVTSYADNTQSRQLEIMDRPKQQYPGLEADLDDREGQARQASESAYRGISRNLPTVTC